MTRASSKSLALPVQAKRRVSPLAMPTHVKLQATTTGAVASAGEGSTSRKCLVGVSRAVFVVLRR